MPLGARMPVGEIGVAGWMGITGGAERQFRFFGQGSRFMRSAKRERK